MCKPVWAAFLENESTPRIFSGFRDEQHCGAEAFTQYDENNMLWFMCKDMFQKVDGVEKVQLEYKTWLCCYKTLYCYKRLKLEHLSNGFVVMKLMGFTD